MKKHFKRGIALLFAVIIAVSLCGCGEGDDFIKPTEAFFVNDFADVITPEDEQIICAQGKALQEQTKAQAVIVTVSSLDGQSVEDYAYEIGENWALGDEEEDNGIVILLSVSDREYRVEVGEGIEDALPASKTGRIMDHYAAPKLATDDFSGALLDVYNAVTNEIYLKYGIETTPNYIPVENLPQKRQESSTGKVIIAWVVMIGVVALYIIFFGGRGGLFIFGAPRFFGGFGGFGGGSSGGFGGFSGGGGSFGGGGASRKF